MTELQKNVVKKFIDDKILLFYSRYADDTLMVIILEHLDLRFTVDTLGVVVPYFLEKNIHRKIHLRGLGIYCKPTNTGQYTHYTSFSPGNYKTAWISNIVHRAIGLCS